MKRVLITGSNRGIGLELTRQCLERGDTVIATLRDAGKAGNLKKFNGGDRMVIQPMDVASEQSIKEAFGVIAGKIDGLDILINNAGVLPDRESLDSITPETMLETFNINAVGPLLVTRHALGLLRKGDNPVVGNISTRMSSLAHKSGGGSYGYSPSKTALNMVTRLLAGDLRGYGIRAVSINPGWVKTDMGGGGAPTSVEDSARGILTLLEALTPQQSGHFFDYQHHEVPW